MSTTETTRPTILLQLDTDAQPSVFDAVTAIDAGIDHLLRHGGVTPQNVRDLVHGCLFTRGIADLHRTAVFVGGSDVAAGEAVLEAVKAAFFGDFRVSVLLDASGANTTAAAAVLAVLRGMGGELGGVEAAVLGATGPVGQRVARLLARLGARVSVGSRRLDRAAATAAALAARGGAFTPFETNAPEDLGRGLEGASVVVAAGAAGVRLLPVSMRKTLPRLKVAVDLNAVPPVGVEGVESTDRGVERDGVPCWGALGIGGTKMKIHRKALQTLFTARDRVLDAEEVLEIGRSLS